MVKNSRALGGTLFLVALAACNRGSGIPPGDQGIVELDERLLAFDLTGRLAEVPVHRGQLVTAGQPLARLDESLARPVRDARAAELAAAQAQLALLEAGARSEDIGAVSAQVRAAQANQAKVQSNLKRARALVATGAINESEAENLEHDARAAAEEVRNLGERLRLLRAGSRPQELSAARARVEAAAAALALEDARLGRHTLAAPIPGAILDVHLEPGEVAAAGVPVLTLADTAHPYADVFVPLEALARVRMEAPACLRVDGEPAGFPSTVEDIGRHTEFTPRYLFSPKERPHLVVRVRVRIDDRDRRLHAGVPAFVSWDSCR